METEFWIKKWEEQTEHGFHNHEFHSGLTNYFPMLNIPKESTILVPLCGMSLDMIWLRKQGHHVIGIELSPIACETFLKENQISYKELEKDDFKIFVGQGISLYCGDFFKLSTNNLPKIDGIYDRAALIALPLEMRLNYYKKWSELLKDSGHILLITLEYKSSASGPPFSISLDEIKKQTPNFHFTKLSETKMELKSKKFVEKKENKATEYTLHLQKKS